MMQAGKAKHNALAALRLSPQLSTLFAIQASFETDQSHPMKVRALVNHNMKTCKFVSTQACKSCCVKTSHSIRRLLALPGSLQIVDMPVLILLCLFLLCLSLPFLPIDIVHFPIQLTVIGSIFNRLMPTRRWRWRRRRFNQTCEGAWSA